MAGHDKNGTNYENRQVSTESGDFSNHLHRVAHGKQDHPTGHEQSRQHLERSLSAERAEPVATVGHGIPAFGHHEIEQLAYQLWMERGCPPDSPQEDWYHAAELLRARAYTG